MLLQAGWDIENPDHVGQEFEVLYPDNKSGKGYVDYVLWGDNGQPLAVIEAKKSGQTNLQAGREQARLYADAFEHMGYQRPVIFYGNGYETFIWDDHQYNTYRPVYGFYSKDSLDYLIYQRHYRTAELEKFNPELSIADRPYQIEAVKNEPPYLVPFRVKDLTTDFLRDGMHYNDLTEQQKRQLEKDLGEQEARNTTIAGKDIGRKIFSEDTDRIILENLINNGIKDETGSLVGKTIIFAQRQDHAEHMEQLFCKLYPQYGNKVCKVIHNAIPHVDSLIKEFKKSRQRVSHRHIGRYARYRHRCTRSGQLGFCQTSQILG